MQISYEMMVVLMVAKTAGVIAWKIAWLCVGISAVRSIRMLARNRSS